MQYIHLALSLSHLVDAEELKEVFAYTPHIVDDRYRSEWREGCKDESWIVSGAIWEWDSVHPARVE